MVTEGHSPVGHYKLENATSNTTAKQVDFDILELYLRIFCLVCELVAKSSPRYIGSKNRSLIPCDECSKLQIFHPFYLFPHHNDHKLFGVEYSWFVIKTTERPLGK